MNLLTAQSFVFGPKFGPVIGTQKWEGFQKDPLLDFHGMLFIESYSEENSGSLFAQLGYHRRGSALRNLSWNSDLGFRPASKSFRFNNLVLSVGAKKIFQEGKIFRSFYSIGIRGEYTINTNLDEFTFNNPNYFTYYPQDAFVKHWNYGLYAAAGFEFDMTDLIGMQLDLSVNPDLSKQYFMPPIDNVTIITHTGILTQTSLASREIRNLTFEISLGFRFLRLVEYIN